VRTFGAGEGAVLVQALSISAPIDNAVFEIADRRVRRDSKMFFTLKTTFLLKLIYASWNRPRL
jgi:hypothetical protein